MNLTREQHKCVVEDLRTNFGLENRNDQDYIVWATGLLAVLRPEALTEENRKWGEAIVNHILQHRCSDCHHPEHRCQCQCRCHECRCRCHHD